jgi:hypothetical protein
MVCALNPGTEFTYQDESLNKVWLVIRTGPQTESTDCQNARNLYVSTSTWTRLYLSLCFCMGITHWKCVRTGCWGEYLKLRGRKWQEAREDCIMRSFVTCTLRQILLGWSNQEGWDRQVCSTHGKEDKCVQSTCRKGRDHSEDIGVECRTILQLILEKEGEICGLD